MADCHGGFSNRRIAALDTDQDFQEEEVWAMMKAREGAPNSKSRTRKNSSGSSSSPSAWRLSTASRAVPRSTAASSGGGTLPYHSSAPISIPESKKKLKKYLCDAHNEDDGRGHDHGSMSHDEDDDMLPPHEHLARRLASTQIASFSMCEGVGRTLKGRDLSNLRNAILTMTGFLE